MLYIASVPGFILTFGMQFAVDSPRWLCKVGFSLYTKKNDFRIFYLINIFFFVKAGRLDDAKNVISNLWGPSKVEKSIEEFQSVLNNNGGDLESKWSELLEEPHSKGIIINNPLNHFIGFGIFKFS